MSSGFTAETASNCAQGFLWGEALKHHRGNRIRSFQEVLENSDTNYHKFNTIILT